MSIVKLAHYSVRAQDLDASRRFYIEVLGLREGYRPPFPFPGAWLYAGEDEMEYGAVHLIGMENEESLSAYLGDRDDKGGCGPLDHIAFLATGWAAQRTRCAAHGIGYTLRQVPMLKLLQVFMKDPSGVVVELNYPADEGNQVSTATLR